VINLRLTTNSLLISYSQKSSVSFPVDSVREREGEGEERESLSLKQSRLKEELSGGVNFQTFDKLIKKSF